MVKHECDIQIDLDGFHKWCEAKGLSLNIEKFKRRSSSAFLEYGVTRTRNHCLGSKLDLKDSLNITLKGYDREEAQFLRIKAVNPSGPGAEEFFKSSRCFSMSSADNEMVPSFTGDLGEVIRGNGPSGSTLKDEAKALANTSADCL
ncbi:hypothetical protein HHI36_013468 [Cryptolaemus montrouzieri]|uniref:Uncharacterized protein n=1 Tax=Cryptolaemus montrouzieri TaxID=559131 RepID=A0ABD2NHG9_9CUCU